MRTQPQAGRLIAALIVGTIVTGCGSTQWATSRSESRNRLGSRYSLLPQPGYGPNSSSVPDEVVFKPSNGEYGSSAIQFEHPKVDAFVLDYETRSRGFFERALDRSRRYVERMAAILTEEGVPRELAYLPLIESGFNNAAVSPAGAVGPWQFISATGRRYGLRIDRYVDERRDPDKSTRAAAQYLKDLYNMFGDWHLSLAAYNTGEYRVARTMDREGTDSYWDMMENRDLHRETCDYVPRFLAALTIAQSPEAHGFESPSPAPIEYEQVEVDRSVSLRTIAELSGSSETEIKDLNPALVRGVTPPDATGYPVHVPTGTKDQFQVAYARMLQEARDAQAQPMLASAQAEYQVRKGDSLASVARRLGVSPQALLRANGMKSAKQWRAGRVLRVPDTAPAATSVAVRGKKQAQGVAVASADRNYRVQKSDDAPPAGKRHGASAKQAHAKNGKPAKGAASVRGAAKAKQPAARAAASPKGKQVKVAKTAKRK